MPRPYYRSWTFPGDGGTVTISEAATKVLIKTTGPGPEGFAPSPIAVLLSPEQFEMIANLSSVSYGDYVRYQEEPPEPPEPPEPNR